MDVNSLAQMSNNNIIETSTNKRGAHFVRPALLNWKNWIGVIPFFLFTFLFIVLPSVSLFVGSFQDAQGNFTFKNILDLFDPSILSAYWVSIRISIATALGGGLLGFLLAYAGTAGGLPRWVRSTLSTFSGVASNFAGVPLAFAFIATLGRTRYGYRPSECPFRSGFVRQWIQAVFIHWSDSDVYVFPISIDGAADDTRF